MQPIDRSHEDVDCLRNPASGHLPDGKATTDVTITAHCLVMFSTSWTKDTTDAVSKRVLRVPSMSHGHKA